MTNALPFGRRNGGEICTFRLIMRLRDMGASILVAGGGDAKPVTGVAGLDVVAVGDRPTEFAYMPTHQKMISLIGAVVEGEAWTAYRMSRAMYVNLRKLKAEIDECDFAFIDHLQMYKLYRDLGLNVPAIVVSHNVESKLYGELGRSASSPAARWVLRREQVLLERMEREVVGRVFGVACVTEAETRHYKKLAQSLGVNLTVECLPSYFDSLSGLGRLQMEDGKRPARPTRIGIVGTWTWESNRLGIEWFLSEVLPVIGSGVEVRIAGQGLSSELLSPHVKYYGFVDSIAAFYEEVDVIAIPSIAGVGIQEKTVEAVGYGVPIVATDIAVRGLEPLPEYVTVANSAAEFALACSKPTIHCSDSARASAEIWYADRYSRYGKAIERLLGAAGVRT